MYVCQNFCICDVCGQIPKSIYQEKLNHVLKIDGDKLKFANSPKTNTEVSFIKNLHLIP